MDLPNHQSDRPGSVMSCRLLGQAVAVLMCGAVLGAMPLQGQHEKALSEDDVVMLLELKQGDILPYIARESCISFVLTQDAAKRLASAGASAYALDEIRGACFSGAELVIDSYPSGAEVTIGNKIVGRAPVSFRYTDFGYLNVAVRANGKQQSANVQLKPGQRTHAFFGITEEQVPIPRIRTSSEVAAELNLASRWKPTEPEPKSPSMDANSLGILYLMGGMLVGGGGGLAYCSGPDRCGALGSSPDDRQLAGMFVGAGVGLVTGWIAEKLWDRNYDRLRHNHDAWSDRDRAAREQWIANHPDVKAAVRDDVLRQEQAQAQNSQIRARNTKVPSSAVTFEPLPGPITP